MNKISKEDQEIADFVVLETVFHSVRCLILATLNIEQMKKLFKRLNIWIVDHEESMRRK